MTPEAPREKKVWSSPEVKNFGSFAEVTQQSGGKDPGTGDAFAVEILEPPRVS